MQNKPATSIYGPELEKWVKDGSHEIVFVGHRKDLGALSIDRLYTDEYITDDNGNTYQILKPSATSQVIAQTADGKVYGLKEGNLTIYSKGDWQMAVREMAGPDTNPDFFKDVLGVNVLDLGPAYQGVAIGQEMFFWNMTDKELPIAQAVHEGQDIKKM
jgi:hypothetical protein